MATPSYTTDLTTWFNADINTDTGTWAELTGHTSGGAATDESDYYIQGAQCVSQAFSASKSGTVAGLQYDHGATITLNAGDCVFVWQVVLAGNATDTFTNGGLRIGLGSSSGNINFWKSGGADLGRNPYGGWQNIAIDPTYTPDFIEGTPTGAVQVFGSLPNTVSVISKGNMHGVDAAMYGRGEAKIEFGDGTNGYGTFPGIATQNDAQANRWGLFSEQNGTYLWKGLLSFGNATNACDFRDANRVITVDNCPRTYTDFNRIEINNAASRVDWTSITFIGATAIPSGETSILARGNLAVVDDATVNFDGCAFADMGTFTFQSNSTITNTKFQRCQAVTANSAVLTGCSFDSSIVAADTSALVWDTAVDTDGKLDNATFIKGTTSNHALELGLNSPTSVTLRNVTFTGYNAANGATDSAIHVKRTTGTVTINVVGGTTPSYKTDGATVSLVLNPVTLTITVKDLVTGSPISGAAVYVEADTGGDLAAGTQIIKGTTDVNGQISDTRTYTSDQPIVGHARKASASPYYAPGEIVGTVSSTNGANITILLTKDE